MIRMEAMYARRRRIDPFLPPWGRWEVAGQIARGECRGTTEPDRYLQAAIRLRKRLEAGRKPGRVRQPARAILHAHNIFDANDRRRWEVQARLMVGQSDEKISQETGVAPEVIDAFERVFCAVRDLMGARDYLQVHLVECRDQQGFGEEDMRHFWAWLGLSGQPLVVDSVIDLAKRLEPFNERPKMSLYLRPTVPLHLRSLVAILCLPPLLPLWPLWAGTPGKSAGVLAPILKPMRRLVRDRMVGLARLHLAGRLDLTSDRLVDAVEQTDRSGAQPSTCKELTP